MPDPTPNRPPLWRVLREAFDYGKPLEDAYAAEIRAIAKEIEARIYSDQPIEAVIELLRAEADRAEAGE
jgi:hypothetical protein